MNQQLLKEVERGDAECVKKLLKDARVDPSYEHKWKTALAGSGKGHVRVVEALLEEGRFDMLCCDVVHDADPDGLGRSQISNWRHHGRGEDGMKQVGFLPKLLLFTNPYQS